MHINQVSQFRQACGSSVMKSFFQKIFGVLAFGALLLALIVLIGIWRVNQLVAELGVQAVDYRIENIALGSATLSRLTFEYPTENSRHTIAAQNISVRWEWPSVFKPRLLSVDIAQLYWQMQRAIDTPTTPAKPLTMPDDWAVPEALPDSIVIRNSHLLLPCPAGECSLAAHLDMQRKGGHLMLSAKVSPGTQLHQQHLEVTADYQLKQDLPAVALQLRAGEEIYANLHTELIEAESLRWAGQLNATARYPADWLRDALNDWHITLDHQWAQKVNHPMDAQAEWQLDVDALLNRDNLPWHKMLNGFARVDLDIASPIAVQDVGEFAGNLALHIKANDGTLEKYDIATDITLTDPVIPAMAQAMGLAIKRLHIHADSRPDNVSFADLPVQLNVKSEGGLNAEVKLQASVDVIAKTFRIPDVFIDAQVKQLQLEPDIQLHNLDLSWRGAATWAGDHLVVRGDSPTRLQGDLQAAAWSLSARGITLAIDQLAVTIKVDEALRHKPTLDNLIIDWMNTEFAGKAMLTIAQLQHPQLHTKPWLWRGVVRGNWNNFLTEGEIIVNNALTVSHKVKRTQDNLAADWQLRDSYFLAGNPFADLVKAWPSLLSLVQGKLNGSGKLTADINKNKVQEARASLFINEVSGIYDTTLFQGVTTTLALVAKPETFTITADEVRVKQINKGFVFGPLKTTGVYAADWQNPARGKLSLQNFYADVIGGSVTTSPQVFDLAQEKQSLVLRLENIDLGMLLQQHPSAELSGSGRISGTVPIEITAKGVSVPKGVVAARPPGGQLQYHSERAEALARSQPGMKLITDALEDFHYTVLASEVSYDENGKLLLALRLEGKNPALEKGRPVHFNINLEEDLPAMIASIQLSNQVSDLVKKRLQEHLQKRSNR